MSNLQKELKFTLQLLREEWKEDLKQYQEKNLKVALADKKKAGICWYPVALKKVKMGYGERYIVEVERNDSYQSHGFLSGKSVSVFSNSGENETNLSKVNGVVNFVRKDIMVITLTGDYLPEWIHNGKLGVDLLFDEASYREMEGALKSLMKAERGRTAELRDILLGHMPANFSEKCDFQLSSLLNQGQNEAVKLIHAADDVAIIHGPPGTGKTTTLVAAICQTMERESQVMVCAPSNAAVDLLVERLLDQGVTVLRIGHPARIDDKILSQTLDAKIVQHHNYKDLKKLRKSAEEYRSLGKKYKRNFGREERAQRKRLLDEAARIKEEAISLENYILYDIFQHAQVIASTLVGANNQALKGLKFPVVFIDEAGQGLEPATWIPVLKTNKVVLAGDHCQLPPTIKSFEAAKAGLIETLFEKVIKRQKKASKMLSLQYRMPEMIMGFSGSYFYNNELKAAENTKSHCIAEDESVMTFIDTAGSGFSEQLERDTLSTLNLEEAKFALRVLDGLLQRTGMDTIRGNQWNIGLISPYRAQVRKFRELVFDGSEYAHIQALSDLLTVDTIDGFQGQERDIIVISLVRSNSKGEIGFLADTRRMNVALTRAKRKLVVIGDSATLSNHAFYREFLNYAEANDLYKSVYEFLEF
ncbi:MAG: AAA domain-containing protein [Anditalea sp.]